MWQFEDDSLAALCTYRQTLQQSRTFARRAFFLFSTQSLSVVTQTLDILFELIPAYRSHVMASTGITPMAGVRSSPS